MNINYYKDKIERILEKEIQFNVLQSQGYVKLTTDHLYYAKDDNVGLTIEVRLNKTIRIAIFNLSQLKGGCGVVISTGAWVNDKYRGKGIGTILNKFRQDISLYLDYTVMLCTDVDTNKHQKNILSKAGFNHVHTFKNKRTSNIVNISVLNLLKDNTEG